MSVTHLVTHAVDGFASRFGADSNTGFQLNKESINDGSISDEVVHLVLDLDHTLISSFEFGEAHSSVAHLPNARRPGSVGYNTVSPILADEYKDEYGLPEMYHAVISGVVVLIKLRPHVRRFIRNAASEGYHLHVYTKGRRTYMKEVIRLIDPDGELIKGKHISRDDEPVHFREYQKDIGLVFESALGLSKKFIVLDDSPQVWLSGSNSKCPILNRAVVAARKYSFSDSFVGFLRDMPNTRAGGSLNYPEDGDSYLSTILVTFPEIVSKVYTETQKFIGDLSPLSRSSTTVDSSDDSDDMEGRMKFQLTSCPKVLL